MELLIQRGKRLAGRWRSGLFLVLLLRLAPAGWAQVPNEYEVKAAFLFKFASFVEWPGGPKSPRQGSGVHCIGVLGQDPFGGTLDEVVAGKFVVRRFRSGQDPAECQILFIASSEKKRLGAILERTRAAAILTVGDVPGFCEQGGMINLVLVDKRVSLEINPEAAGQAHLQLSSRLLSLARIVHHSRTAEAIQP